MKAVSVSLRQRLVDYMQWLWIRVPIDAYLETIYDNGTDSGKSIYYLVMRKGSEKKVKFNLEENKSNKRERKWWWRWNSNTYRGPDEDDSDNDSRVKDNDKDTGVSYANIEVPGVNSRDTGFDERIGVN